MTSKTNLVYMARPWFFCGAMLCFVTSSPGAIRGFTVSQSIGISAFENAGAQENVPARVATFSPDGTTILVVTVRGDLATDERVATMWLFDAGEVQANLENANRPPVPHPLMLLRVGTLSNQRPISDWRWSSDSRSIIFLQADDEGIEHLQRVSIESHAVTVLSRPGQDVLSFDESNGHVVYLARHSAGAEHLYDAGGRSLPDVEDGTGKGFLRLVFPNWHVSIFSLGEGVLYEMSNGIPTAVMSATARKPIHLGGAFDPYTVRPKLSISPNGRLLLATAYVRRVPRSWEKYRSAWSRAGIVPFVADTAKGQGMVGFYRPREYVVVNLESGKLSRLIDAPVDWGPLFYSPVSGAWSVDGSHVAVPGVFPPLRRAKTEAESRTRSGVSPCAVGIIDVDTGEFSCPQPEATLEPRDTPFEQKKRVVSLTWANGSQTLIARYATLAVPDRSVICRYDRHGGHWHAEWAPRTGMARGLRLYVDQALNKPPVLMASLAGGVARKLLDPNPQLKSIALGTASLYRWRYGGKLRAGVLVTPPDFSSSRRYPLVIQADPVNFGKFFVDGPAHSAFVARELAAREIVVLQVPDIGKEDTKGWAEENAANYRAAVLQLGRSGMVYRHLTGIIGWSHSGVFVLQSLIDDPSEFRAASIVDGSSSSYSEFLANVDYVAGSVGQNYLRDYIGAWPWGDGLKIWLARSPGFHTDRICAPILYQANDAASLVFLGWDDYAILRAQHKPVDLVYIRNGAHALLKPRERLVEQGLNVDWFAYWLEGRVRQHPSMAGEYQRWEAMRKSMPVCAASVVD